MKKLIAILVFLVYLPLLSIAQKDTIQKSKIYKTWVTIGGGTEKNGILYQTKDSSVVVVPYNYRTDLQASTINKINMSFDNILSMKIRSKNSVRNGVLIGMSVGLITGVITGVVTGYAEGDDPYIPGGVILGNVFRMTAEEKAQAYGTGLGVFGAALGAGIGAAIGGSMSITIPIYFDFNKFHENRNRLKGYSYIH